MNKNEIDTSSMTALGINICSRHGKAKELAELLLFADAAAKANVHQLVERAFYDSNSCCCTFEFKSPLEYGSNNERTLLKIATKTIEQFEWFGTIHHGR
ncbi:MAG: hypothetical protein LBE21_05525 [Pseudomonadales bacterium]|jgi:hypothetical protein|nr:hypothetical protein [Pseudomonadales bacterium]